MAGAITQRQPESVPGGGVAGAGQVQQTSQMSMANSFRVAAVATRLTSHMAGHRTDPKEFVNLCLALARGIDYAVANNEVPARAQELPTVVKQVCHRKGNIIFQAVIMVLMVSVKNACRNGWFQGNDDEELLTLANEIVRDFCSAGEINIDPSPGTALYVIPEIMSRFYPRMKMGHIFASLEAKPGYGAYVIDFNIPKNAISTATAQEKIRLFVAQTDSIETSSCITSPPQVSFLLNGKGVDRRINVSMDNGPQFPTIVNSLLKFGTNLLQVVGQFNGKYVIAIVFMSVISSPGSPMLQDYAQPVAAVDSDADIIEGPSRISLNCPISHTRIRTPVKGHLCKHHQCFDYDNFLEINSRRPSWRCPHCNHSVCYTDLRIDQNMVKVLKEVAEGISDVIILVDGSWKSAFDGIDQAHQLDGGAQSTDNNGPEQHDFTQDPANVVDLTGEDDERYTANLFETEDRKPFQDNFQGYPVATSLGIPLAVNATAEGVLSAGPQIEDEFWEGIFLSTSSDTFGPSGSNSMLNVHAPGAISESTLTGLVPSPVLTDALSPALNREVADILGGTHPTNFVHSARFSAPFNLQIQTQQFGNSIVSAENGRPALSRNISRTPIAVQALPAQAQVTNSNQRLRNFLPRVAPLVSQSEMNTNGSNAVGGETERQQQLSRLLMNATSDTALSSSMQHPSVTQTRDHPRLYSPTPLPQVVGLPATSQVTGASRSSSQLTHQQPPSLRLTQNMNRSSTLLQPAHFPRGQVHQGGVHGVGLATGSTTNQHQPISSGLRAGQMARPPTVPVQIQSPRTGSLAMPIDEGGGNVLQPISMADGLGELSSEHNWRPSGRMRGSLTGPAYSAALSQYMGQSTPAQVSGPPPNQSLSSSGPSQMHVLVTNSINAHGLPQQGYSRTGEATRPGSMGHLR